jgi:DNA-binding MarR family transcriptional regulator
MRYQRQIQAVRRRGRRNAHRYPTAKDKTARAFAAYVDLCEAAEYLTEQMRSQLATFDLSTFQFRLLATLLHNGAQYERAIAHQFQCSRQNVSRVIKSLERRGAVELCRVSAHSASGADATQGRRPDPRLIVVRLTEMGESLIRYVFPVHAKVVKAEMKVLDGRQQETLSRMCVKLREGDAVKFVKELMILRGENRQD